jgi:hypothetical protein
MNPDAEETLVCKVSKIVGAVKREHENQVMLCEFKNDEMKTTIYEE